MTDFRTLAAAAGIALAASLAAHAAEASVRAPAAAPIAAQTLSFTGAAPQAGQVKWGHRGFRGLHGVKRYGATGFRRLGRGRHGHGGYGRGGYGQGGYSHRKSHEGAKKGFFPGLPFFGKGVVIKK